MLKQIEKREFKKAISLADNIIKFKADHGETIALKGYCLKHLDQSEEGYKLANEGLRKAITSYLPWYCIAQMYAKDCDYANSLKSYLQASKLSPNNLKILGEMVPIQTQLRDYKGLLDTRIKMVQQKPTWKPYILGLSLAQYLNKQYDNAIKSMDVYIRETEREYKDSPYDLNELLLFKAYILREAGQWKPLVEFLKSVEDKVMDEITWLEDYALALFNSGRKKDAADTYKELLTLNSENHTYLAKYQEARGFSDSLETPQEGLLALYDELATQFPDSSSIKRIPLNFATGEEFRKRLEVFVKPYIRKTIPSLFSVLKSLYHNQDKVQVIEQVFTSYLTRLESTSKFPGESQEEAPSTLLWVLIYLSYHYDRLGQTKKAIEFIDRAIEHTPTVVELYLCKGRLMKVCII
jgi:peptide alpha-N-acetyltransferase